MCDILTILLALGQSKILMHMCTKTAVAVSLIREGSYNTTYLPDERGIPQSPYLSGTQCQRTCTALGAAGLEWAG